ncbi:MAG: coenzyme F430 synthase [Methanomethylovorans sp.]|nr:coenzyme F430 synthase [Methanomethylovorans sp.]
MYRYLCDPSVKNVAVLDMTHGGIVIARKLKELGLNVTGVDVYGTLSPEQCNAMEIDGIWVSEKSCPIEEMDLIISPVHLYPDHIMLQQAEEKHVPVISHHRAVGEILTIKYIDHHSLMIEVTGTKAKTSTASLLADMISRKLTVVLHTSRGLELWEDGICRLLHRGLSIAPGSILQAVDIAGSLERKIEAYIFEISLGVTGFGSVGIITTLDMDYMIAGKTSMASEAKIRSLISYPEDALLVLNDSCRGELQQLEQAIMSKRIRTFSTLDKNEGLTSDTDYRISMHGNSLSIAYTGEEIGISLAAGYDARSYMTAFAASSVTSFEMGIPWETVKEVLQNFRGLQGRMQEMIQEDISILDNSNSGMDIVSVEKALNLCMKRKQKVIMVLGEETAQVCEGLPPEDVADLLRNRLQDMGEVILVGERMKSMATENIRYAESFDMGKALAMELARIKIDDKVIIALCVKCFR